MKTILDNKISTIMKDDVICVGLNFSMDKVVHIMMAHNNHGIVVVDDKGNCQGFLSVFDIMNQLEKIKISKFLKLTAEDVMTKMVIDINPDYTIRQALKIMRELHIHHLVIGSAHSTVPHKPAGIVSVMDVMEILKKRIKKSR